MSSVPRRQRSPVPRRPSCFRRLQWTGCRALLTALLLLLLPQNRTWSQAPAPTTSSPPVKYVPAAELEAVFSRDGNGVVMRRAEFEALLQEASAGRDAQQQQPRPIVAERAELRATLRDSTIAVVARIHIRQFADSWQVLPIPLGNLNIEQAVLDDGSTAVIARDPENSAVLRFASRGAGVRILTLHLSTTVVTAGNDRIAAFDLPGLPATRLQVSCPAGQQLLLNDQKLGRPSPEDQAAEYDIPVGAAARARLRWTDLDRSTESQTLVFVRTDGNLKIQKETFRWSSESRVSVYGGTINQIIARVPSRLEVTGVEASGLEAWELQDDPDATGFTRVVLSFRQPFSADRVVTLTGVSSVSDTLWQQVPTLHFNDVTTHSGRLMMTHEDGLRLTSDAGAGVRQVRGDEVTLPAFDASVFDFWQQDFELSVAVKPRDQELFSEVNTHLLVEDTSANAAVSLTIETLNAPLFEVPLTLPPDWHLSSVTAGDQTLDWRVTGETNRIVVIPASPIPESGLFEFVVRLQRAVPDPEQEQQWAFPVVLPAGTTIVGGLYHIRSSADLTVSPVSVTGLAAVAAASGELTFRVQGATFSGTLAVSRKVPQLISRAELRTWADARQLSLNVDVTLDVINGTTRELTVELPEELGSDVRFHVVATGAVPGLESQLVSGSAAIVEQTPLPAVNGMRPFLLKLQNRFAGSLTLRALIRRPLGETNEIAAPKLRVAGAVRQQGVLVFEAYPEQQLTPAVPASEIAGVFVADPAVASPPPANSGRRVALIYRFISPDYAFTVSGTRFTTAAVPSAICESMKTELLLNETGDVQQSCRAEFRLSGVQTLRFLLPGQADSFLWSTLLNNEPVEVRRDDDAYLVAIPRLTGDEPLRLELLFESASATADAMGRLSQSPVSFSIDVAEDQRAPVDVLRQEWLVRYPRSTALVENSGAFRAVDGTDQPGWFRSFFSGTRPSAEQLRARMVPLLLIGGALFVVTALIHRRRWKTIAALTVLLLVGSALALPLRHGLDMVGASSDSASRFQDISGLSQDEMERIQRSNSRAPDAPMAMPAGEAMFGSGAVEMADLESPADMSNSLRLPGTDADGAEMGAETMPSAGGGMGGAGGYGGGGFGYGGGGGLGAFQGGQPGSGAPEMAGMGLGAAQTRSSGQQAGSPAATNQIQPPAAPPQEEAARGEQLGRKGAARLSVRVNLESPPDYQSREFLSLADVTGGPTDLNIVVQHRERITAMRMFAALVVILLCWFSRSLPPVPRILLVAALFLAAIAAIPLAPNRWQSVLDGLVLGCCGALLWVLVYVAQMLVRVRRRARAARQRLLAGFTTTATLMGFIALSLTSHALAQSGAPPLRPELIVPYTGAPDALNSDQVFLPHAEFLRLYQLAHPGELTGDDRSPLGTTVVAAFCTAETFRRVDDSRSVLRVAARYVISCDSAEAVRVALPLGKVAIVSATLDGTTALLAPRRGVTEPQPQPAPPAQQMQQSEDSGQQSRVSRAAQPLPAWDVRVAGAGLHVLDLEFDAAASVMSELGEVTLPLLRVPSGTLKLTVPLDNAEVRVNGSSSGFARAGNVVTVPLTAADSVRVQWQPDTQRNAVDTVYHTGVTSAFAVMDAGVRLRSQVEVNVRQGDIQDLQIAVPLDYSVQSVDGPDVAGWELRRDDHSATLHLQLRRSVPDRLLAQLTLFRDLRIEDERTQIDVPILKVIGATRDTGTVTLLTGDQFQVRSDGLAGVSQINPQDAPLPEDHHLPGRRMLAWRYTRHPATVAVRVSRTTERLEVTDLHAMQLEDQRLLWTSRFQVRIVGTARSRVDIHLPGDFLVLETDADGLADWYIDTVGEADASTRILRVLLESAREGTVTIAVHGQVERAADASAVTLQPPEVLHATKRSGQLAVWLDSASENAGVDPGDWTIRPIAGVSAPIRELLTRPVDLALQTTSPSAAAATVQLRRAVPTILTESVTVTTATDASVELTLALNWQITRAAAETFVVDLPTGTARALTFDVPNHRRTHRDEREDGVTRVTFELQEPVSDRLFVLGTGSLPLGDGTILPGAPEFRSSDADASAIAGQSHFWVIVNQSAGLFEPTGDPDALAVTTGQLKTSIPQAFLDQQVSIQRLTDATSAWKIEFPVQYQVTPAVVTLASHKTVLADDGSWRSQHVLDVRNESRQFLPVRFPEGARLLYCRVGGRPTRVVRDTSRQQEWHLIPIPQSGLASTAFEVEFALAGRLASSAEEIRESWQARRLQVPVPSFPEFRDDPELGISISRNRWSVYVPRSWHVQPVDDPRLTNVEPAAEEVLEDVSLRSALDQASSLLSSAKSAKGAYLQNKMYQQLEAQSELIRSVTGNASAVESERQQVLSKLGELKLQLQTQDGVVREEAQQGETAAGLEFGNFFLMEQDQAQNSFNSLGNEAFLRSNRAMVVEPGKPAKASAGRQQGQAQQFRFGLPETPMDKKSSSDRGRRELEEKSKVLQGVTPADSPAPELARRSRLLRRQSAAEPQGGRANQPGLDDLMSVVPPAPATATASPFSVGAGNAPQSDEAIVFPDSQAIAGGLVQNIQAEGQQNRPLLQNSGAADSEPVQQDGAAATGTLSLVFEIPADGDRHDFVRTGGNAVLSLDARAAESVTKATGFGWAAACGIGLLALLTAARRSALDLVRRLCLLAALAACCGWMLLASPLSGLCLTIAACTASAYCITFLIGSFRRPAAA